MNSEQRHDEWAWQHVEAAADGSLSADEHRRFEAALSNDPRLRAVAHRAHKVCADLRALGNIEVPSGLLNRLWSIPDEGIKPISSTRLRSISWAWFAAPAAALSVAALAALLLIQPQPVEPDPREVAVQEFLIAMNYLQEGATIASSEIQGQVRNGFLDAFLLSRESLLDEESNSDNGG